MKKEKEGDEENKGKRKKRKGKRKLRSEASGVAEEINKSNADDSVNI